VPAALPSPQEGADEPTPLAWQQGWQRIAWRAAGSWIAASGLLLLGWSLR
jgi:hypothetical protein